MQSSLHLLPSTTGLFKKISGLSLAEKRDRNRHQTAQMRKRQTYFRHSGVKRIKMETINVYIHPLEQQTCFIRPTYGRHDILMSSHETCTLASRAYISAIPLAHITQADTSLVKNISPVITGVEVWDFSHVKQSHVWLRGAINHKLLYLK